MDSPFQFAKYFLLTLSHDCTGYKFIHKVSASMPQVTFKKQPIVKLKAKKKYLGRGRIWGLNFGDRSLGCGGGAG